MDRHRTFLWNQTDNTLAGRGQTAFAANSDGVQSRSFGAARVTIADAKAFEIRHRCETTFASNGFGVAETFGGPTVFTQVYIKQVT